MRVGSIGERLKDFVEDVLGRYQDKEFKELGRDFIESLRIRGLSQNTVKTYSDKLEFLREFMRDGDINIREFSRGHAREYMRFLIRKSLRARSVNLCISVSRSFFRYLIEEGFLGEESLFPSRLRVKERRNPPAFLTEEEVERLKRVIKKVPEDVKWAYLTQLSTGLRVSEVVGLRRSDVFRSGGILWLKVRGKGGKGRVVPVLNEEVAEILKRRARGVAKGRQGREGRRGMRVRKGSRVFGVDDDTLKWWAWTLSKKLRFRFNTHRLRHTFATKMLSEGVPLEVIQGWLGHSSIMTTTRYAAVLPRVSEVWARRVLEKER